MESKIKETKSEKFIKNFKAKEGFEKHEVIKQTTKDVQVVFGNDEYNFSKLVNHNFSKNETQLISVNGELPFDEFVIRIKNKQEKS